MTSISPLTCVPSLYYVIRICDEHFPVLQKEKEIAIINGMPQYIVTVIFLKQIAPMDRGTGLFRSWTSSTLPKTKSKLVSISLEVLLGSNEILFSKVMKSRNTRAKFQKIALKSKA